MILDYNLFWNLGSLVWKTEFNKNYTMMQFEQENFFMTRDVDRLPVPGTQDVGGSEVVCLPVVCLELNDK